MQNHKFSSFLLSGFCLMLGSGAVLGQQRPPTPAPPPAPTTPLPTQKAPVNPLLANPATPKPARVFTYTVIPYEMLEPSVQMTPDQIVKIKPIYMKLDADIAALRAAAQTPEQKSALNDKFRALQAESNKQIDAILDPAQRKKAEDTIYEMAEMISVGVSPQMLRELKLTPDQRVAILKIEADVQQKLKAMPVAERRPKYAAMMEAERVRIPPLLTPTQRLIFDKYDTNGRLISAKKPVPPVAPAPTKTEPTPITPAPEKKP